MENIVGPLLIAGLTVTVCAVLFVVYRGGQLAVYWLHNTTSPPKAYPARVIHKRTETSGWSGSQFGHIDTYYFVTFEFRNGERREYEVSGQEFGMLVEGDEGQVTAKGTRYEYFDRAA